MPCIDVAAAVGAMHVLDTRDASKAIDAINAASAAGVAGAINAPDTIAAIAGWLLTMSWQLIPLAIVVIMLDLVLRRAGPVVRSALWWMVLAKLILPPGLASPLSIAQLWSVDDASAVVAATNVTPVVTPDGPSSLPLALTHAAAPKARSGWKDLVLPLKSNRASGAAMLLAIWAAGAIAAAVLVCWRYRRVRAACLEGASRLIDGPDVHMAVAVAAARRLGLSTLPPIVVGANSAGLPAVVGFFRPCVVLPRALLDRPCGEIEHVLLHELAHVRRRDPLASLVCLAAQIVFWFHPAIWCARRRLATLREMACDRTVARLLGDATPAYRRTLILLARSAALGASPSASASGVLAAGPGALGLFQRQSQLVTRLDALARPVSMRRATERVACAAVGLAILVSCVPLASTRAAPTASFDVPPLDRLEGSLQKRYAVMRAMALEAQAQQPSR
jgi:beta-lactamase regulating signal transducer with metallopeptidase domain